MIVSCARIILVFSFISTEVRGSENGVTETVFRKIFAPDSDVPVQYKSLEGNKLNPKEIYLEVNCILCLRFPCQLPMQVRACPYQLQVLHCLGALLHC